MRALPAARHRSRTCECASSCARGRLRLRRPGGAQAVAARRQGSSNIANAVAARRQGSSKIAKAVAARRQGSSKIAKAVAARRQGSSKIAKVVRQ